MDILLVDQNDFKTYTNHSQNIDVQQYRSSILVAQSVQIEPCLGTALYEELMTQKDTNTLTPANVILMEYVSPAIVHYATYDIIPLFYARFENKGITTNNETTQTSVDMSYLKWLRGEEQVKADWYKTRLINYLNDNASLYPLYVPTNCGCEGNDCKPRNQGIHFYKSRK